MKKIKLKIENNKDLELFIQIHLNQMTLTIIRKLESLNKINEYSKRFEINEESKFDEIFEDFYVEYIELKNIEYNTYQILNKGNKIKFYGDDQLPNEPPESS